jgi:pyruvate formate lyase activating enzyme
VEITTLLIPGENDSPAELEKLVGWISEVNPEMPLHFSRYFPSYNMETDPTAPGILEQAWKTAKKKLKHVYVGNIDFPHYSKTFCSSCENALIERNGYNVKMPGIKDGLCAKCGRAVKIKMQNVK